MPALRQHKLIKILCSQKVTVFCLLYLAILVFFATLYQVDNGINKALAIYIRPWFINGIFPSARFVMWVLSINLVFTMLFRFRYNWKNIGLLLSHGGLLYLFVGSFVTFHYSQHSHVEFREGDSTNVSVDFRDYELAVWEEKGNKRAISAVEVKHFQKGATFTLQRLGLTLHTEDYLGHCVGKRNVHKEKSPWLNATGLTDIQPAPLPQNLDQDLPVPGGRFVIKAEGNEQKLLLYGAEDKATTFDLAGKKYSAWLRRKHYTLPFSIKLKDFKRDLYANSNIPKNFSSLVSVQLGAENRGRDVLIKMNQPLRYGDFTLYQSRYIELPDGTQFSILEVVENKGRLVPYISCSVIFLGLLIHFMVMLFRYIKRQQNTVQTKATA